MSEVCGGERCMFPKVSALIMEKVDQDATRRLQWCERWGCRCVDPECYDCQPGRPHALARELIMKERIR